MDTSRAEMGSSHRRNSGSTNNALAIPILWRCPPENSYAYLYISSDFNPTFFKISSILPSISSVDNPETAVKDSFNISRTLWWGSKEE